MTKFVLRDTFLTQMPVHNAKYLLHPDLCVFAFGDQGTIDLGACCFLKRDVSFIRKQFGGYPVEPSSFNKTRATRIRELITLLSDMLAHGTARMASVYSSAYHFIRFLDWADGHFHGDDILLSEQTARRAFRGYVEQLREDVHQNRLKLNSATRFQRSAQKILQELLAINNLAEGIRLLKESVNARDVTSPPDEASQGRTLGLAKAFFDGFSELAIDNRPYPYQLAVPDFLGWHPSSLWIFPTIIRFVAPHERSTSPMHGEGMAYDYINGRVRPEEELRVMSTGWRSERVGYEVRKAAEAIARANADRQHYQRRRVAMVAHNAFVLLFLAHSGMNWASIQNLPWDDNFEVGTEHQGFRTVKYRAGGKPVSFRIETVFLPVFKRFLSLRRYLLNGVTYPFLFFSYGADLKSSPGPMGGYVLSSLNDLFKRLDPSLKLITSREWRAAKSDWLLRTTDPSTTALFLQNTERVVLKHYAAGSESLSRQEIGGFFEHLSAVVRFGDNATEKWAKSAVGNCTSYGLPHPNARDPAIAPDCHQPEGCLFCDKYAIHADETDTRKLLSCRFCISETEHLSRSSEQFERLFGDVLSRIDLLLKHISSRSVAHECLVIRVRDEVENEGILDPYWDKKMEMLVSLGMVA